MVEISLDTFDKCMQWVKKNVPSTKETKLTIIGDTFQNLGLEEYMNVNSFSALSSHERKAFYWNLQEKVGENMYTGTTEVNVKYSLSVGLCVPKDKGGDAEAAVAKAEKEFAKELKCKTATTKE